MLPAHYTLKSSLGDDVNFSDENGSAFHKQRSVVYFHLFFWKMFISKPFDRCKRL